MHLCQKVQIVTHVKSDNYGLILLNEYLRTSNERIQDRYQAQKTYGGGRPVYGKYREWDRDAYYAAFLAKKKELSAYEYKEFYYAYLNWEAVNHNSWWKNYNWRKGIHEAYCYVKPEVLSCQPKYLATVNSFFRAADDLGIVTLYGKNWADDFAAICAAVEVESSLYTIWADRTSQIMPDGTWDINQGYPEIPIGLAFHQVQQALLGVWSKYNEDFATYGWAYEAEEYSVADITVKVYNNYLKDDEVCLADDQIEIGA